MCLELYAIDQPVQLVYEEERIRFETPFSATVEITVLVRNTGYRDITQLHVIYPSYLFRVDTEPASRQLRVTVPKFSDISGTIPDHFPTRQRQDPRDQSVWLSVWLPDPNYPLATLLMEGYWNPNPDNLEVQFPKVFTEALQRTLFYCEKLRFAPFVLKLRNRPIRPQEAHWYRFRFRVDDLGTPVGPTLLGHLVFHEVIAPIDVRRTMLESTQNVLRHARESADSDDRADERILAGILDSTGLLGERRVDMQYFQLTLEPGDPMERLLVNSVQQGDLRMQPDSPGINLNEWSDGGGAASARRSRTPVHEPVYQWKSGSSLDPSHPWKNSGFSLRFGLIYRAEESDGGAGKKPGLTSIPFNQR